MENMQFKNKIVMQFKNRTGLIVMQLKTKQVKLFKICSLKTKK